MKTDISIIVPVYNTAEYLAECIESVLRQSFFDYELILINDGSTDSSGEICDRFAEKDRRIKVFHRKNGGVSEARNYGISQALGKWICFIDSDDWIEPDMLSVMHKSITEYHADLFVSKNYFGVISKPSVLVGKIDKHKALKYLLNFNFPTSLNLLLVKREVLHGLRLHPEIHHWEDYEFMLHLLLACNMIYVSDDRFYHYRQRLGSANHVPINDKVLSCMKIPEQLIVMQKDTPLITSRNISDSYAFFFIQCLFFLLKSNTVKEKYFGMITRLGRMHWLVIITSKRISLKCKILVLSSVISSKLTYRLFHKLYTRLHVS